MSITNGIIMVDESGWVAAYGGGAHIEISHRTAPTKTIDTINVWDYEADRPLVEMTRKEVAARFAEWVSTYGPEYLTHAVPYLY